MTGRTETEVKLRVGSPETVRRRLAGLGAVLARERHFEDNLLLDDAERSLRAAGCVLRLRTTPLAAVLTFKGPREVTNGIRSREERETKVESAEVVLAILRQLGFTPVFHYQKYRESWSYRGQEIEVDETPVGSFLEIEGDAAGIAKVAAELGYQPADYVSESYVGLFLAAGGQGDMVFPR
jgi:adenylate cyclase class 2